MRKFAIFSLCAALAMAYLPLANAQQRSPEKSKEQAKQSANSQAKGEKSAKKSANQAARGNQPSGKRASEGQKRSRLSQLNDLHLATWVLVENDAQVKISEFAKSRVKTPQVKDFASRIAESHRELIANLNDPIQSLVEESREARKGKGLDLDYSKIFAAVGKRLEQATESGRQSVGYRGDEKSTEGEKAQSEGLFGQNIVDEDAREMFRRNLPALLDVIERSVGGEDAENTGLAFVELKRQLGDRFVESMKTEMEKSENVDQAYLGFEVAANMKLLDTMQVAKQHASPELKLVLDEGIRTTKNQLEEARRLMKLVKFSSK